jgi:two-component system, NtrC family, sensor kinase
MKFYFILILFLSSIVFTSAQQSNVLDSLQQELSKAKNDTSRVSALSSLADYYGFIQFDSSLFYAAKTSELSQKINYPLGSFLAYKSNFFAFNCQANYPRALEAALNFQKAAEQLKKDSPVLVTGPHYFLGVLNREMGDYPNSIAQLNEAIRLQKEVGAPMFEMYFAFSQLGILYLNQGHLDSALKYAQKGYDLGLNSKNFKKFFSLAIAALGNVHVALHDYKLAEEFFRMGINQSGSFNNIYFQTRNYNSLAGLFAKTNRKDSCIYYAKISLQLCLEHNFGEYTVDASKILSNVYESENKPDSALKYMKIMLVAKDSVFSQTKGLEFQRFAFSEIQRLQNISAAKEKYQNQVRIYALVAALTIFLLVAFILYRNNRQKQKANLLLERQKQKVETTLTELKSTQSQLIQSEKMASLGELTAGIAHEIQNPLNFVNNFSEVSNELIEELQEERNKTQGSRDEELENEILNDIKQNLGKINHHGKRADAIVKGMLQHSRSSTGVKEPTDINALADEYLRLAYHGLRAKDKEFNAEIKTDFDDTIGKINIIPQDIGRVLLNLYNNAFYAVNERVKAKGIRYEPAVSVNTKKTGNEVFITVSDNGNGIPQKIIDKIFQPFFTTKPTGQGTGLGLSLSYDIIKAHGGGIKVNTKENEGSEFIIQLPV